MDIDLVPADLPGDVGVVRSGGDDFQIRPRHPWREQKQNERCERFHGAPHFMAQ
jgi:hypothetical protein